MKLLTAGDRIGRQMALFIFLLGHDACVQVEEVNDD
jgi:hypothetical protein